jgi:hypothetical protein
MSGADGVIGTYTPRVNVEAGLVDPPSFVYVNSVGSLSSAS